MNRRDLQSISRLRVREAKMLLERGFYSGAYYLLGYAVECALKACIAKQIKRYDFPDKKLINDSYTHDLEKLLSLSGLKDRLQQDMTKNPVLELNWTIIKDWSEQTRYDIGISQKKAEDMYYAVNDKYNGVLIWLKKWW